MAGGAWEAMVAPMPTRAQVTLRMDGRLEVAAAASDIGTGTYTILAQIAAAAFGLDIGDVNVRLGDSTLPMNPVEGGSWMAASTGAAVAKACERLKRVLATYGRARLGLARGTPVFTGGRVAGANGSISLADIVAVAGKPLSASGTNLPRTSRKYASYSHSAVFAEVRVDEDLAVVRVTRIVTAVAAGRILNPKTARSQILGGVVMGIGKALHEEGLFDHRFGRVMNANFADYHVPTNADIYDIDVIFVDEHDDKVSPLGVKGVGEIGIVAVAPAIANAIYHATGRRIRDLPITLDKLL
jgi:xanthine dehydrogenase YagR molybdenum-binding subunit